MSEESVDTGAVAAPDTTDQDAVAAAANNVEVKNDSPAAADLGWMFSAGVKGEGDAPDWFKSDKYKTVSDQAEAYKELEGKFGSFTGAPDEFSVSISDELAEKGVEFDAEDPLMQAAIKFATERNMNQEGFDEMINLYAMSQLASNDAIEQIKTDEIKSLGDNAQNRLANISKWGNANLSEDQMKGLQEMATSSESVKTIEKLISLTRAAPIAPEAANIAPSVSESEVKAMQFEKDEHGNRRIHTDKEFAADFRKKSEQLWGSQEHRQIIG